MFKKTIALFSFVVLSAAALVGCKDKCEEAADILKDCGASTSTSSDDKCDDKSEKAAQCIIDNKDAACEVQKNPLSAANPSPAQKTYLDCITAAGK